VIDVGVGLETRVTLLGHLQRGGSPTACDRLLATNFGPAAAHCACRGEASVMVALRDHRVVPVPIKDAIARLRTLPSDDELVRSARAVGVSFGDKPLRRSLALPSMTRAAIS
jgi:6-phosphofructokinase 1